MLKPLSLVLDVTVADGLREIRLREVRLRRCSRLRGLLRAEAMGHMLKYANHNNEREWSYHL